MCTLNEKLIKAVIETLISYENSISSGKSRKPIEFVKDRLCEKKLFIENESEKCFEIFLKICSLRQFLCAICKDVHWFNTATELVHCYLILFEVNTSNQKEYFETFLQYFKKKSRRRLKCFLQKTNLIKLIEDKLTEFNELSEQTEDILEIIKDRVDSIEKFPRNLEAFEEELLKNGKDDDDNMEEISKIPKRNALDIKEKETSQTTVLKREFSPSRKATSTNLRSSSNLYSEDDSLTDLQKPSFIPDLQHGPYDNVGNAHTARLPQIKLTKTQILRANARIVKNQEEQKRTLKEICKGSPDPEKIKAMLKEIKEDEILAEEQKVQEKHLRARISQEDAKLAKLSVRVKNHEKAEELKSKNSELEKQLAEHRQQEGKRIRQIIEECHSISDKARVSQVNLFNKKRQAVKKAQEDSKNLNLLLETKRQQELDRKVAIIRQIKNLQKASSKMSLNSTTTVGMSSKSSVSLPLSCSMSIEELKESLVSLKAKIEEDVQKQREKIQQQRLREQKLIESAKESIQKNKRNSSTVSSGSGGRAKSLKLSTKPLKTNSSSPVKTNPEILKLKKQLERKLKEAESFKKILK